MSGPIPHAVAEAAGRHAQQAAGAAAGAALRADADARGVSIGRALIARYMVGQRPATEPDSLPGRTWRAMSVPARTVVVMLAASTSGDPREAARQPWESFSDADRASMAACARDLSRELRDAACLF